MRFDGLPYGTRSAVWFDELANNLKRALTAVEAELSTNKIAFRRATAEYWREVHDVNLGVAWHVTGKTHLWRQGPEGLEVIAVTREDIEGPVQSSDGE